MIELVTITDHGLTWLGGFLLACAWIVWYYAGAELDLEGGE